MCNCIIVIFLYVLRTTPLFLLPPCPFVSLENNVLKIWIGIIFPLLPVSVVYGNIGLFLLLLLFVLLHTALKWFVFPHLLICWTLSKQKTGNTVTTNLLCQFWYFGNCLCCLFCTQLYYGIKLHCFP